MVVRGRWARAVLALLMPAVILTGASCADLQLAKYRNEPLVAGYHYTLGEKYLAVDGLKFCYQEMGQGDTVLILPGLGTSIDYWQFVMPPLAEHHHVVAVDLPGFGKSDKPDASYALAWIVERILGFMDAKGIRRTSVIGGSLGGHLALIMALDHPDRVSKLVLMGSVGNWEPPDLMRDLAIKTLWSDRLATNFMRERWPEIFQKMFEHPTPFTQRTFAYDMALRADAPKYAPQGRAASRAFRSILYSSCRDRLKDIPCPVLLVWGEDDQIHTAAEIGMYFRDHLPDSRLVVVPDSAHEVMVDQPEAFGRLVLAFLKSGTAGVADRLPAALAKTAAPPKAK